ncbi:MULTISPECIES: helix-turn-helix domain-containing protein [unclassified Streptomyces]|uniref:helix-turn-helix domain-containing protein n=1 Tax=unclassified Streptomyces TaxID=2593676 RepID=UPI001BE8527A|nr:MULTISPECIES: helix-turn-helix domain-containing protein [unclassified Streptomyces]MBT2407831.1 GAF domain-containing protein [Streptomyces sp. ISL-21]MBT2608479.1 GAF domain-containing protein [Streptomyces sp. ISL-87]
MGGPSVALPGGADPAERTRVLRQAHTAFTQDGRVESPVRAVIAKSWRRCVRARVSPECTPRVELAEAELSEYRERHPLARVMPVFRDLVGAFAANGAHLLAVCDARGSLLWVEGEAGTLRRAEDLGFVPGAHWAETAMGTNAPGTAVAVGEPVQVFGAEHFSRRVHPWTCAAAPVRDPRTGGLLGAVDITGGDGLAHPHSLAFVQAVARAAEAQLALLATASPAPADPAAARDTLTALGRDEALLVSGGREMPLGRRHSEIMALLAHHPEGLSGEELAVALYEDESVSAVTLRAEISRLRGLLGARRLLSRPYRTAAPLDADFTAVTRYLAAGAVSAALNRYPGPLLPASTAPGIARLRRRIEDQARAAVIARADPGLLTDWVCSPWGADDAGVWRALAEVLPPEGRPAALARVRSLDRELAAEPALVAGRPERPRRATYPQPARS